MLYPTLELPQCIPIDYMHAVLEGAFKALLKHWFDSKYHGKVYSLRKHIPEIDKATFRIKPPKDIPRSPRSLTLLSFWKASEYHAWLFYCLPILTQYLPAEYMHHLSLLVSSIFVLLSDEIHKTELDVIEEMLCTFHQLIPVLYSPLLCTANMHLLIHLVQCVRLWGPLWIYSMFAFENVNGHLRLAYHGTGQILKQILFQVRLKQTLPYILQELKKEEPVNSAAYTYIENMLTCHPSRNMQLILPNVYAIGKLTCISLTQEELSAVMSAGIFLSSNASINRVNRCMINGIIYHSTSNCHRKNSRNNMVCSFKSTTEGLVNYGVLKSFCTSPETAPFCIITKYTLTTSQLLSEVEPARHPLLQKYETTYSTFLSNVIIQVTKLFLSSTIVAVPILNICKRCIHIPIKGKPYDYLIVSPNTFEVH